MIARARVVSQTRGREAPPQWLDERNDAPPLLPILRSRHQADLLAVLLLHPDRAYTLTDLARLLKVGRRPCIVRWNSS